MILASLVLLAPTKPQVDTFIFVTSECPIAQRYTPEINRIIKAYGGVSNFQFQYEDVGVSQASLDKHHKEYKIGCGFTLDKDHSLAKALKVKTVPTAVVRDLKGNVLYMGRIDDAYGRDFRWHPAKQTDLRNALDAVKKGVPVKVKSTKVIGCALGF